MRISSATAPRTRQHLFECYVRATSWAHMVCVCALTMVPPFGSLILIELMPVAAPDLGWSANWVYWVRSFFNIVCITTGASVQIRSIASNAPFTNRNMIAIGALTSVQTTLVMVLIARSWVFPIPCTDLIGHVVWTFAFWPYVIAFLGPANTIRNPVVKKQLVFCEKLILTQGLLLVIYPGFAATYAHLKGMKQAAFSMVLPLIKLTMKRLLGRLPGHTSTSLLLIKATVDIFEALFVFKCMQAATSWLSVLVLSVVDLVLSANHIRSFYAFDRSEIGAAVIESKSDFVRSHAAINRIAPPALEVPRSFLGSSHRVVVAPTVVAVAAARGHDASQDPHPRHLFFLHCREILLIKFIECAITMFYLLYFIVLCQLPNIKYYPEVAHMTTDKMKKAVGTIATYALVQSASLLGINWILQQHFHLSALHVLAYTLEMSSPVLHGTFMLWAHLVLQMSFQHNGTWK